MTLLEDHLWYQEGSLREEKMFKGFAWRGQMAENKGGDASRKKKVKNSFHEGGHPHE